MKSFLSKISRDDCSEKVFQDVKNEVNSKNVIDDDEELDEIIHQIMESHYSRMIGNIESNY
jgi:hypothetical protein